jgi:integrase
MLTSAWHVDPVKILTRRELTVVLIDLGSRSARSANLRMNKVILRLACCCGLRVSEIGAVRLSDVCVGAGRPHLRIGPKGAKGKKPRIVPLWWDAGTLEEIIAWKREREVQGGRPDDAFVSRRAFSHPSAILSTRIGDEVSGGSPSGRTSLSQRTNPSSTKAALSQSLSASCTR